MSVNLVFFIQENSALHTSRSISKGLKTATVRSSLMEPMDVIAHLDAILRNQNTTITCTTTITATSTVNTSNDGNHPSAFQIGAIISLYASIKPQTGKSFVLRSFIGFVTLGLTSQLSLSQPKVLTRLMLGTSMSNTAKQYMEAGTRAQ